MPGWSSAGSTWSPLELLVELQRAKFIWNSAARRFDIVPNHTRWFSIDVRRAAALIIRASGEGFRSEFHRQPKKALSLVTVRHVSQKHKKTRPVRQKAG